MKKFINFQFSKCDVFFVTPTFAVGNNFTNVALHLAFLAWSVEIEFVKVKLVAKY